MVTTIDCHYVRENIAAAYLLHCGTKACFIDNNTNYAVPSLIKALAGAGYKPEDVEFIVITHVHLDHAGGTGLLLKACPNAKVIAHPRAAPHLIDPSRLVKSAQAVYGEKKFHDLYGSLESVPAERVITPTDGERLAVGDTELTFIYTRGHANHHFVIVDKKTQSVFTGDSFGIAYPMLQRGTKPFLFPSTSPTDFDAQEALKSLELVLASGAKQAYPTHFGVWKDMQAGADMLSGYLKEAQLLFDTLVAAKDNTPEEDYKVAFGMWRSLFDRELAARGVVLTEDENKMLQLDLDLNAQGVAFAAERARKKARGT